MSTHAKVEPNQNLIEVKHAVHEFVFDVTADHHVYHYVHEHHSCHVAAGIDIKNRAYIPMDHIPRGGCICHDCEQELLRREIHVRH